MSYADPTQLAALVGIRSPTTEQEDDLQSVLDAATKEIDSEIDRPVDAPTFTTEEEALLIEVNLDRGVELWHQRKAPFGLYGLDSAVGPTLTARNTWERHANKLAPLKLQWGLA